MIGIVAITVCVIVIDSAVTGHSFVVGVVHVVLYSTAQYAHGDFLICYAVDIVALSTDLLLAGL